MNFGIEGKKALVTGASAGIGAAAAVALAREGVELYINSRDRGRLEKAANKIAASSGVMPKSLVGDIAKPEDVARMLDSIGGVDILISNHGGPPQGFFEEHSPERWSKAADLVLYSAVNLTRAVLSGMVERKWGRLIYVTSVAVLQPVDDLILSNTFRAGVTGFCKTISNNYAKYGITANCVCPGYTSTERLGELAEARAAASGRDPKEILASLGEGVPAKRLGRPDEIGAAIAFLASEQAAYVTGTSMAVDGGAHKFII